jgi:hypothetical protein
MEKKSLKLGDFYQLEEELNGKINPQTGEKITEGLLAQKLSLNIKYWLLDMAKRVKEQKDQCETLKNEIIKKYGEEADGMIQIKMIIKNDKDEDIVNPAFINFQNEFNVLLNEERELEYKKLKLSDIGDIETSESYPIVLSLLDAKEA